MKQHGGAADSGSELHRFTFAERSVHWVASVTFVVLLLTGLALSYPSLYWLTAILGGGPTARALHPWVGLLFTGSAGAMLVLWFRHMLMRPEDWRWLRSLKSYAVHDREGVPPTGKYNGGQKLFFWTQCIAALVFLVTGFPLWFPAGFGRELLSGARFLHYLATVGGGLFLTLHIYLGTVAYPGTARGMLRGTVTRGWAQLHHPKWAEEWAEGEAER